MSDGNIVFAPKFDHLIYVRVFEGCNLHCQHCFIPSNPKRMTHEQISEIPSLIKDVVKPGSKVLIQWHGGEPTIFGADWMKKAINSLEQNKNFQFIHGIQTNLINYSDEWKDVYKEFFNSSIGVSYDPKIRLMKKNIKETNKEFENVFWKKFQNLLNDNIEPYMVITATKTFFETYKNPYKFYQEMYDKGVKRLHLERVTGTGEARKNWDFIGLTNAEYSKYMSRFMKAYYGMKNRADSSFDMFVSPFDGILSSIDKLRTKQVGGYGCWSGKCDTTFHTIDANGYKRGCTAITSEFDNSRFSGEPLKFSDPERARGERKMKSCQGCKFQSICSSGCLAITMDDGSGECSGGFNLFENAYKIKR